MLMDIYFVFHFDIQFPYKKLYFLHALVMLHNAGSLYIRVWLFVISRATLGTGFPPSNFVRSWVNPTSGVLWIDGLFCTFDEMLLYHVLLVTSH